MNRIGCTCATARLASIAPVTAFHFGASYPKEQVRLDGERKIYDRDADSCDRIRFHFCPNCGSTLYGEGNRNPAVCGVAVGAFDTSAFAPPSDSIWEEWMQAWLRLPESMDHDKQGRPPATGEEVRRDQQAARNIVVLIAGWAPF